MTDRSLLCGTSQNMQLDKEEDVTDMFYNGMLSCADCHQTGHYIPHSLSVDPSPESVVPCSDVQGLQI